MRNIYKAIDDPVAKASYFDTVREYQTINGVPARGGSLDGPGPIVGGGMLYVNSGYTVDGGRRVE